MGIITIQGIVYDEKSSFLRGPGLAPPLIRKAYHSNSANYYAEDGQLITPNVFEDTGDHNITDYFDISETTLKHLELGNPMITFGGDHSITFPIIKAFYEIHGKLDILHVDAHGDLYEDFEGDPYSHACPFYNIMTNSLVENLYQVGIRTLNDTQRIHAERLGVKINEMKDFDTFKMPVFKNPVYLSLDIDALDPAYAPGVSHHEPGGLSTRQVIEIIQKMEAPLVGADIVEYNPTRDINDMTAMVCAKLFKEIAAKML
nr:agmatinase [uncultured Allomuricauda sp.]